MKISATILVLLLAASMCLAQGQGKAVTRVTEDQIHVVTIADSYYDMSLDTHPPDWATDGSKEHTGDWGRLHFYRTLR